MSDEAWDLITRLLVRSPDDRLGAANIDDLLNHRWFAGLDASTVGVPFRPELASETSTEYFSSRYEFGDQDNDILTDMKESQISKAWSCSEAFPFESVSVNKLAAVNLRAVRKIKKRQRRTSSYVLPTGLKAPTEPCESRLLETPRPGSVSAPNQGAVFPTLLE